jgi:hypothetical protein
VGREVPSDLVHQPVPTCADARVIRGGLGDRPEDRLVALVGLDRRQQRLAQIIARPVVG